MKINTSKILLTLLILLFAAHVNIGMAQDSLKTADQNKITVVKKIRPEEQLRIMSDSLRSVRNKFAAAQAKINEQSKGIEDLRNNLTQQSKAAEELNGKVDEMNVLGIGLTKSSFTSIATGIILLLTLALAYALFIAGKSSKEAKYRITLFSELSEEFQAYKVKANEKEKKLARELQDERNKIEEMKGR